MRIRQVRCAGREEDGSARSGGDMAVEEQHSTVAAMEFLEGIRIRERVPIS
jgi:hypothetical protein